MSFENPIRKQFEGIGNINYQRPASTGAGPGFINVAGARNGLSVDAFSYIVLGQVEGASTDTAQLLDNREVPFNGFNIKWRTEGNSGGAYLRLQSEPELLSFFPTDTASNPQQFLEIVTVQGQNPTPGEPYGNFQCFYVDQAYINPDGQRDAVITSGYNTNGVGGRKNTDEAAFMTTLESHYQQNVQPTDIPQFEWYVQSINYSNVTNRHLFMITFKDTGFTTLNYAIDSNQFSTTSPTGGSTVNYAILDTTGLIVQGDNLSRGMSVWGDAVIDGAISIVPEYASGGVVQFNNLGVSQGAANPAFRFVSPCIFEATTPTFSGAGQFYFLSFHADDATPLLQINNSTFGQDAFRVTNNGISSSTRFVSGFATNVAGAYFEVNQPSDGTAGTAPIKLPTGATLLTVAETGALEFDGTNLYFTVGGTRKTVTLI